MKPAPEPIQKLLDQLAHQQPGITQQYDSWQESEHWSATAAWLLPGFRWGRVNVQGAKSRAEADRWLLAGLQAAAGGAAS